MLQASGSLRGFLLILLLGQQQFISLGVLAKLSTHIGVVLNMRTN